MDPFVRKYADLLGASIEVNQFDGGSRVTIRHGGVMFTSSAYWGEESARDVRLIKFLHTLPWPHEDDPRVAHTGEYSHEV